MPARCVADAGQIVQRKILRQLTASWTWISFTPTTALLPYDNRLALASKGTQLRHVSGEPHVPGRCASVDFRQMHESHPPPAQEPAG
jgi:hypothetical protein